MKFRFTHVMFVAALCAAIGCGGGSIRGESPSPTPTPASVSSLKTVLTGLQASLASRSFNGYGSPLIGHGSPVLDPLLQVWVHTRVSSSGVRETFYSDAAATVSAGGLDYTITDGAFGMSGAITLTSGPFSGLSGQYTQVGLNSGATGTVNLSLPSGGTLVSEFAVTFLSSGQNYGTATIGVALPGGYSQTQSVSYAADGSSSNRLVDNRGCVAEFSYAEDLSGHGTIHGPLPGLPATFSWDSKGNGVAVFADTSSVLLSRWQIGD